MGQLVFVAGIFRINLMPNTIRVPQRFQQEKSRRAVFCSRLGSFKGQTIGLRDTLIAAVALTGECSIATRNQEHFNKISDLKIICAK